MCLKSVDELVFKWIRDRRLEVSKLRIFYKNKPSLDWAISYASHGMDYNRKRHSHQSSINIKAMRKIYVKLSGYEEEIRWIKNFEILIGFLSSKVEEVKKKHKKSIGPPGSHPGPLYLYDLALRIGYYLKLLPKKYVYTNCGAVKGARYIGLKDYGAKVLYDSLPIAVNSRLTAYEAEDFLCYCREGLKEFYCAKPKRLVRVYAG